MNTYMVISAPGMAELKVSLSRPNVMKDGVSVWEWSGSALDEGDEAAHWFTSYLGKTCRLVRFDSASQNRPVDQAYAPGHNTMFTDEFPFLLSSQESLDELNKHLNDPVPMNRFRPNILVEGCEPFAEDLWAKFKIGNPTFQGVKLCPRCKIPTIDQDTGILGSEPNETLKVFRSDQVLRPDKKQQKKVYFGQFLVWKDINTERIGNVVKVGDSVFVLKMVSSVADAPA